MISDDERSRSVLQKHYLISVLLSLLAFVVSCSTPPENGRPNVLVYLLDTVRADHLGCYGYGRSTSPSIDRLAEEGVVFENVIAQASWTKPSTASILTSLYPSRHGAINKLTDKLPDEAHTLAEVFKNAGYSTAGFITMGWVDKTFGFEQGFDTYVYPNGMEDIPKGGRKLFDADEINELAFRWLDENGNNEFFMYIHSIDPHDPYSAPGEYRDMFNPNYGGQIDGSIQQMRQLEAHGIQLPPRDLAHLEALYDGEIAFNDEHVGALINRLESMGILDNTIVVIVSDHGEEFYEHGGYRHGKKLYNELLHLPLIIRFPDQIDGGGRIGALVQSIDLAPTLVELAGLDIPDLFQGKSLMPLVNGSDEEINRMAYSEEDYEESSYLMDSVIKPPYKLIHYPKAGVSELFDLYADPLEQRSISDERPELVADLMAELTAWKEAQVRLASEGVAEIDEGTTEQLRSLGYID
jgi:arylsulfatase A-like enzyme